MTKTTRDSKLAIKAAKKGKKTELVILMDESGSMSGFGESVVTSVNEFIHDFKKDQETKITLVWFDRHPGISRTRFKVKSKKASDVKQLKITDYKPRGLTPLNDAVMDVVEYLDKKVGDGGAFVTIITDGLENASETSSEEVKKALKKREKQGWLFVYLGANQNAEEAARRIGLAKKGQAFNFNPTGGGMRATTSTASRLGQGYTSMGASGTLSMAEDIYIQTDGKLEDEEDEHSDS